MRGKEYSTQSLHNLLRITPAHAGKSTPLQKGRGGLADHPRTCGEKFSVVADWFKSKGSPPHMRGKVSQEILTVCHIGITPAHAGKRLQILLIYYAF